MKRKQIVKQIKDNFLKSKGIEPLKLNTPEVFQFEEHPEWFNELAFLIFNNYYDYSKCHYIDKFTKVTVIDPKHGEFQILPFAHLIGIKYFGSTQHSNYSDKGLQEKIKKAFVEKYQNLYDYSEFEYLGPEIPSVIICNRCHEKFLCSAHNHLEHEQGCRKCNNIEASLKRRDVEGFIEKAKEIHGDKYDYSIAEKTYQGAKIKVEIICKNCGEHFMQTPDRHINLKQGCPNCCRQSFKGENEIKRILTLNNIEFNFQQQFEGCKYKKPLTFDFYIPLLNLCIEYQGKQHFEISDYYGGEKEFKEGQIRDQIKREFCKKENINLIEIPYNGGIEEYLYPIINRYKEMSSCKE